MKGKFSSYSKFLPILLLMIFVGGILILAPLHQAQALDIPGWGFVTDAVDKLGGSVANSIVPGLISSGAWLLYWLFALALHIVYFGVHIAAWAVDIFFHQDVYDQVLRSNAIITGWTICRDLCNLFFVLLLLVIAFATIFRIQTYSAKALLPKFILAIFLINFSMVIATTVVDFGQILMFEFVTWMGSFGEVGGNPGAMDCLTSLVDKWVDEYKVWKTGGVDELLAVCFALAFSLILMMTYFILAGLLLARLIALAILIIVSPFAFIGIILPQTRSAGSGWWSSLLNYALLGPIFVFFIYLASELGQELMPLGVGPISKINSPVEDLYFYDKVISKLVTGSVVIGILLTAVSMGKKLGGAASGILIGGTFGVGLMASKAYRGARYGKRKAGAVGGQISKRTPVGRGVDKVKSGYRGALKKIGLHGAALEHEGKEDKKKEAELEVLVKTYGDYDKVSVEGAKNMASGPLASDAQKAYYLRSKVAHGETLDDNDKKLLLPAQSALSRKDLGELTNKQVGLTTETAEGKKKVNDLVAGGANREDAKKKVIEDKISELVSEGKAGKVIDLGDERVAKAWHDKQTSSQRDSGIRAMTDEQRKSLGEGYMANTLSASDYATATAEQKKEDLEYKTNAVNVGKGIAGAFASGGADAAKDIEKAFSKFDPKRIAKFTERELKDYGHAANASQLRSMNRDGKQDELGIIRDAKNGEISRLEPLSPQYNNLKTKRNELKKEKDPAKRIIIENNIKVLENLPDVKKIINLEKGRDNIDSMISGEKY